VRHERRADARSRRSSRTTIPTSIPACGRIIEPGSGGSSRPELDRTDDLALEIRNERLGPPVREVAAGERQRFLQIGDPVEVAIEGGVVRGALAVELGERLGIGRGGGPDQAVDGQSGWLSIWARWRRPEKST
jgi:hypothetical protein